MKENTSGGQGGDISSLACKRQVIMVLYLARGFCFLGVLRTETQTGSVLVGPAAIHWDLDTCLR